jgi:adenylate cyclase
MAEPRVNRKLAAILSADVVGYSKLMADDEAATVDTLKQYRAAVGRVVERHKGRIVNAPGDNILAEFASAVEAVQAAVEIQISIEGRNVEMPDDRRMRFRVGVNLGDVIEEDDGTIYGDGVNIAARLEALAEEGGICISSTIYDAVEGKLDFGFDFLGERPVKNIAKPVRVYRVRPTPPAPPAKAATHKRSHNIVVAGAVIVAAIVGIGLWQFNNGGSSGPEAERNLVAAFPDGPSIAVLPFSNVGGDPEQIYFADGITEEITTALTRFPDLIVIPRNSSFRYKDQSVDIKKVGRALGAKYVLEGSVQKAADAVRVTARLLDAIDGRHLWAETYERDLSATNIFAIQDEITEQVVGMIGGSYGIIAHSGYEQSKRKAATDLQAYECVLRVYTYRSVHGETGHREMRDCLERAVRIDPDYADAWAWLSFIYAMEYSLEYNPRPDPLTRAADAGQRAVEIDPTSGIAHMALARSYFFKRELDLFVPEAEKAVTLNPSNSDVLATMGYYLGFAGEYERGLTLMRKAMSLSASYPGWLHESIFWIYFRQERYEGALAEARLYSKMMPRYGVGYALAAAAYGQLGRRDEAQATIAKLRETETEPKEYERETWIRYNVPEDVVDRYLDGLHKAGLDLPDGSVTSLKTKG